jgi:cytoskeletal protein CcmA (bactofilin family)
MFTRHRGASVRQQGDWEADVIPSRLGRALTVTGRLDIDGELQVYGFVFGRINGYIEGDVAARDVWIGGRLNGRVFALNVTLYETAKIEGRIFHHSASVARGATIDGRMPWRPINYFDELEQLPEKQP